MSKSITAKNAGKVHKSSQTKVSETITAILGNKTLEQAAKELKITYRGLRKRMVNHPEIKEVVDGIVEDAMDRLKVAAPRAADVIIGKLDDKNKDFDAAKEVLDRVGVRQSNAPTQTNIQVNITPILGGSTVQSNDSNTQVVEATETD